MSTDNIVLIKKSGDEYKGYNVMVETWNKDLDTKTPDFVTTSVLEAIIEAQNIETEYGYRFINLDIVSGKLLTKERVIEELNAKIDRYFEEKAQELNLMSGDISAEQSFNLENLIDNISDIIIKWVTQNQ